MQDGDWKAILGDAPTKEPHGRLGDAEEASLSRWAWVSRVCSHCGRTWISSVLSKRRCPTCEHVESE